MISNELRSRQNFTLKSSAFPAISITKFMRFHFVIRWTFLEPAQLPTARATNLMLFPVAFTIKIETNRTSSSALRRFANSAKEASEKFSKSAAAMTENSTQSKKQSKSSAARVIGKSDWRRWSDTSSFLKTSTAWHFTKRGSRMTCSSCRSSCAEVVSRITLRTLNTFQSPLCGRFSLICCWPLNRSMTKI